MSWLEKIMKPNPTQSDRWTPLVVRSFEKDKRDRDALEVNSLVAKTLMHFRSKCDLDLSMVHALWAKSWCTQNVHSCQTKCYLRLHLKCTNWNAKSWSIQALRLKFFFYILIILNRVLEWKRKVVELWHNSYWGSVYNL